MKVFIKTKAVALSILFFVCACFFVGCTYKGYKGDTPELYTVAWNNIPTLYGYMSNGEVSYDASVKVLEKDGQGRVLFTYTEDYTEKSCYVLIMQRADDMYAYYYPDDCYVFIFAEEGLPNLDGEEVAKLKSLNDWNKPIDEGKGEAAKIIRKKPEGKIKVSDYYFESIVREYHESYGRYIHPKNVSFVAYYDFMRADDYGRELYVLYTRFYEYAEKIEVCYNFVFLVVVNPDKSYDSSTVILLEDRTATQEDMKKIKAKNDWNTPLGSAMMA